MAAYEECLSLPQLHEINVLIDVSTPFHHVGLLSETKNVLWFPNETSE